MVWTGNIYEMDASRQVCTMPLFISFVCPGKGMLFVHAYYHWSHAAPGNEHAALSILGRLLTAQGYFILLFASIMRCGGREQVFCSD